MTDWRRWGARGATVVAALAVIATSPARWGLSAAPPKTRVPASNATLVTIEASQRPSVTTRSATGHIAWLAPVDPAPAKSWPGRAQYLIPEGDTLEGASIVGVCAQQGMCAASCTPPQGAFVRFANVEAVTEWKLVADSDGQSVSLHAQEEQRFEIVIEATRDVDLRAQATALEGDAALLDPPSVYDSETTQVRAEGPGPRTTRKMVAWRMRSDVSKETPLRTIPWVAHATIRGFCPATTGACNPPDGESVRIVSVSAWRNEL